MGKQKGPSGSPGVTRFVWALLIGSALALGALAAYVRTSDSGLKKGAGEKREPEKVAKSEPTSVQVLTPKYVDHELRFNTSSKKSPSGADPKVYAVNAFLEGVKAVPKGARAKSCTMEDGVAKLDFSTDFGQTYGTDDEQTILNGVLTSLGQFDDVKYVQFLVDGKPLDSLGNVDLSDPQKVIRPTSSKTAASEP